MHAGSLPDISPRRECDGTTLRHLGSLPAGIREHHGYSPALAPRLKLNNFRSFRASAERKSCGRGGGGNDLFAAERCSRPIPPLDKESADRSVLVLPVPNADP